MEEFIKNNITLITGNINQQARIIISNIFKVFNEFKEDPQKLRELKLQKPRDLTAMFCGVSLRTVDRINREAREFGEPQSPRRKVHQPRPVTHRIGCLEKSDIKEILTSYYDKGEDPSVQQIYNTAKEKIQGFKWSINCLRDILKDLGFKRKRKLNIKNCLTVPGGSNQLTKHREEREQMDDKNDDMPKILASPEQQLLDNVVKRLKVANPNRFQEVNNWQQTSEGLMEENKKIIDEKHKYNQEHPKLKVGTLTDDSAPCTTSVKKVESSDSDNTERQVKCETVDIAGDFKACTSNVRVEHQE